MNILKKIKTFFLTLLGIVFFAFALVMTILLLYRNDFGVTEMDGTSFIVINDEISSEVYKKGDLVLVKKAKLENIAVGEEVFAYSVDEKKVAHVTLGIVGDIYETEKAISYENGSTFSIDYVIGKTSKIYQGLGTLFSIFQSQWGFLFLILVPGFLIFIYEVYALIIEIKYGDEEMQD